ncbi:MAG: RluA family pseudouridine synthase [Geminicoccaceae bacterium]|nr:RluA family pseudouridine synthase [Geminicoccaceae bacterium]
MNPDEAETPETIAVRIDGARAGQRLDAALAALLPGLSRARLQALLHGGFVQEDGAVVSEGKRRVKGGERFEVRLPEPADLPLRPEAIPLAVVFEDDDLLVVDKPAGLVVHPAPGHATGTLVHALLAHCGDSLSGIGGVRRPGIVHRIDKDVSGLLVVAKNDRAHLGLAGQFSVHSVERAYAGVVYGLPPSHLHVEAPIGRHPVDRKRMAVVAGGKRAVTDLDRLEATPGGIARVRCTLHTGRTHQIRVHLQSRGHPLLGDPLYKPRKRPALPPALAERVRHLDRILLHAQLLGFSHPTNGLRLRFESAPPAIFDAVLELARA